jgi:hypothetical protein
MRSALLLLVLLALSGCSLSVSDMMPKAHGPSEARSVHVSLAMAPAAAGVPIQGPAGLDLSSVARSAVNIPHEIQDLERTVVGAALALGTIGLINAALLIRLATIRARERMPVSPEVTLEAAPVPKTCACGTTISVRTKSGRCRRCALELRRNNSSNGRRERVELA